MEEYQTMMDATEEIDKIEDILFHSSEDNSRIQAAVGLMDISNILDKRVNAVFGTQHQCVPQIYFIKQSLM